MLKYNKVAVSYVRTSSLSNPKESIPNQIDLIQQYCDNHEIILMKTFIDEAKTGTKVENREQYQVLKKVIEQGSIDMVIVSFSNRLGREAFEIALTLNNIVKKKGIEFVSVSEGLHGENLSPLQIGMLSIQAEMENKQRIKVTQESQKKALRDGKFAYSTLPFGYKKDKDGYLIAKDGEAKLVRKIFQEYINGKNPSDIEKHLRSLGERKPDGNFLTANHINKILQNKTYTGIIHRKSERVEPHANKRKQLGNVPVTEHRHEAIISEDEFEQVEKIRAKIQRPPKKIIIHLLRESLFCPNCNIIMYGEARGNRYICKNRREGKTKCTIIPKPDIESKVKNYLSSIGKETHSNENNYEIISQDQEKLIIEKENLDIKYAIGKISQELYEKSVQKINQKMISLNQSFFSINDQEFITNYSLLIEQNDDEKLNKLLIKEKMKFTLDMHGEIILFKEGNQ